MLRKSKKHRQWILVTVAALLVILNLRAFRGIPRLPLALDPAPPGVDVVYTWVNGSDPAFLRALGAELGSRRSKGADARRFRDNEQLKYSLRSLSRHAGWTNRVFVVTNGQTPAWLNTSHPRVRVVSHGEIFPHGSHLPTFSSPAIESHLHRTPGLSPKFLYFNDDFLLGADIELTDFETFWHGPKVYLSSNIPGRRGGMPRGGTARIEDKVGGEFVASKQADPWDDPYVKSLQYTSHIFEIVYKASIKKQVAHMPHLISKAIMEEVQTKLSRFYERTSSHKLRDPLDLQMALSYFGHLMFESLPSGEEGRVRRKYRYEVVMIPITNDVNQLKHDLKTNLKRKVKFLCLNDNLDYNEDVTQVLSMLEEFYETRFPDKSPFEKIV